jgi:hypothetical protein
VSRKFLRTAEIKGFLIGYEKERAGGQTFAFAHCPHCGKKFEIAQLQVDAGLATAEKILAHIAATHNSIQHSEHF